MIGVTPALLGLMALAGCGAEPPAPPTPVPAPEVAPAPGPEIDAAAAPDAPAGRVRVLHHRMSKGKRTPEHVSATWVADGLQVMITGFASSCEPPPSFSVVSAAGVLRLVQDTPESTARCPGTHTMMLQIDGLDASDLKVEVHGHDGKEFGATELAATDH